MTRIWLALIVMVSPGAQAYYSTLTTGELLKEGHYKVGAETQFVTENDSGVNFTGRFDGPINDELGFRGELGFGEIDFNFGGFVKWVPIPDTDTQPAIGVLAGVTYANYLDVDILSLRAHPFLSKAFPVEFGVITPYAALPVGLQIADDDTDFTLQIALGTEFKPEVWPHVSLMAELGFNVSEAFPYFSLNAALEWDEDNGIVFP